MKKVLLNKNKSTWTRINSEKSGNDWSVENELLDFLYGFTRLTKPFNVIEIGTFEGASAVSIGKALEDNKQGHLWTFDMQDFGQVNFIKQNNLSERVSCIIQNANDMSPLNNPILNKKFNMAFIDDGHEFESALRDLKICHDVLEKNGYIIGHDVLAIKTVNDAFNVFLQKNGVSYEKIILDTYCGLFILKKII